MFSPHQWSNRNSQGITKQMNLEDIKIDTIEYQLSINSKDRAFDIYPSPFHFKVLFSDLSCNRNTTEGKRHANINRRFKNIRYFSIEKAILPAEVVKGLMYVTVTVKGVRNDNYYSTSENNQDAITNLYFINEFGPLSKFACFEPYVFQKRFAYISGEINHMEIIFKDPDGKILEPVNEDDQSHLLINLVVKNPILNH